MPGGDKNAEWRFGDGEVGDLAEQLFAVRAGGAVLGQHLPNRSADLDDTAASRIGHKNGRI